MLLEIQDTKHASPPNVSRGGVLHTNEAPGNCLAIALGRRSNVKVTMNTSPDRQIKTRDSCVFVRNVCDMSEHYLRTWASGCPSNATAQRHPHYMARTRTVLHSQIHPCGRREWLGLAMSYVGTRDVLPWDPGAAPNLQARWERRRAPLRTHIWVRPDPPFTFHTTPPRTVLHVPLPPSQWCNMAVRVFTQGLRACGVVSTC